MFDCRKCVYFIYARQMTPSERNKAVRWLRKHRPGKPLLGYCTFYQRPVTYYDGKCQGFHPREDPKPMKLTFFLKKSQQGN